MSMATRDGDIYGEGRTGQPGLEPGIAGFGDRSLVQFGHCPKVSAILGMRSPYVAREPMHGLSRGSAAHRLLDPLRQERLADLREAAVADDQLLPFERLKRLLDR